MITARTYETLVFKLSNRLERYSTPIGITGAAIYGFALGRWGYEAGGAGGAIIFTIGGLFCGGMLGLELPKAIITALGTITRLMVLLSLIVASIAFKLLFNSLSLGLLIFIATCLFLFYLRYQDTP